jgi:catechol 2,3-dioxygenase-like lactoylglutathione lyase family enzyme
MHRRGLIFLFAIRLFAGQPVHDIQQVGSIGITVSDLDRSVEFYSKVLHFQKVSETEHAGEPWEHLTGVFGLRMRTARLRLGDEFIELTEYLAPQGRPIPADSRSNDLWFQHIAIITSDMSRAYQWLRENQVRHASSGPQRLPDWNRNAGGIEAFYFKDPDGHALEVLAFPPDKGAAKWHRPTNALFLGIDHTAIVISNTEASTKFYENVLGFHIAGESENYGPEQEHLNGVFGARLRITALRVGDAGPGIEFLEYLAPSGGRPYPADASANDLIHWQTQLLGTNIAATAARLRDSRATFVSNGVAGNSIIVRDPDGHAIQISE